MGRLDRAREAAATAKALAASFFRQRPLYHINLTDQEAKDVLDALDVWIEGYKDSDPEDDEVVGMFEAFASITDVRNRLWRQMHGR